jgi:hypothetical protein
MKEAISYGLVCSRLFHSRVKVRTGQKTTNFPGDHHEEYLIFSMIFLSM